MNALTFVERQIMQIRRGGRDVLFRKIKRAVSSLLSLLLMTPLYVLSIPVVVLMRGIRPWFLVRLGILFNSRIGHFAANTELYLCEHDTGINSPSQTHLDIFFYYGGRVCNRQLEKMWKRVLRVWPAWILAPVYRVNRLVPGGSAHEVGFNTQHDRDVHNLLDRCPPHLTFTAEEEAEGLAGLRAMGIQPSSRFVCLLVRDSAYLDTVMQTDWSYHNYRDSDIRNYVECAEELGAAGYYVVRMGAKVRRPLGANHPRVIDYATNGMRSEFMDIYLGAKCEFCLSTSAGWDAVPMIFRRPIAYVNMVPLGYLFTFRKHCLGITKHHYRRNGNRELTVKEIFSSGIGFSTQADDFASKGIELVENTPDEIRDLAIEMAQRVAGEWRPQPEDEALQARFWELFPADALDAKNKKPLHGEIRARFGAAFLRNNRAWLQ